MEKILQHIEALQERLQSLSEEMALVRLQLDDLKLLCQAAFEPSLETPEVSQEDAMIIGAELAATALLIDDESSEEDDLVAADEESLEESETESLEVLANEVPDSYEDAPVFTDDSADDAPDFDADEISDVADEHSNVEEEEAVDEMVSENPVMDEAVEAEASDGEPEANPEVEADFEIESEAEAENETEANFKTEDDGEPASETLAESLAQERPDSLAERYEKQLAQKRLQNTLAAQRYADFSRALSLNDRFRYQRELFNNNREALSQLLAALDSMETWAEAEDYLSSYQWDEDLPVVQEFYAMIEQHFNQ
ncbi:MAG: hypothetical protein J6Q26_06840 [Bacteroidales bacterium]|nr:hypothetical protein [Bacteroidales bacterium]